MQGWAKGVGFSPWAKGMGFSPWAKGMGFSPWAKGMEFSPSQMFVVETSGYDYDQVL